MRCGKKARPPATRSASSTCASIATRTRFGSRSNRSPAPAIPDDGRVFIAPCRSARPRASCAGPSSNFATHASLIRKRRTGKADGPPTLPPIPAQARTQGFLQKPIVCWIPAFARMSGIWRRMKLCLLLSRSSGRSPRQQLLGPYQMRPVIHHAADADDAGAWRCGESGDHRLGMCDRVSGRGEYFVDDRHLRWVNRHFADEAVATRLLAFAAKSSVIAEIDKDRIDRGHLGCRRAGKAQTARQPIRIGKAALFVAIGPRAELSGEILGAPGHADQPRARARKG